MTRYFLSSLTKWLYVAVGVWDLKNLTKVLVKNVEKAEKDSKGEAWGKCPRKLKAL